MGDFRITFNELAVYLIFANIVLGILFGAFPLISGLMLKKRNFAVYGFIGSIIGGAILGALLSFPIAFIFTWLILRNSKQSAVARNESSFEAQIQHSESR